MHVLYPIERGLHWLGYIAVELGLTPYHDPRHTTASFLICLLSQSFVCLFAIAVKPGMSYEWCKHSDEGLPMPDTVLYMDITAEAAAERGGFGGERYVGVTLGGTTTKEQTNVAHAAQGAARLLPSTVVHIHTLTLAHTH